MRIKHLITRSKFRISTLFENLKPKTDLMQIVSGFSTNKKITS